MLDKTMGAQEDFERRREELSIISHKDVSDEDVVDSFVSSLNQGGFFRKFLFSGKLGYIHRDTLFVHGAADSSNFGYVPGEDVRSTTPHEWIAKLNAWLHSELLAWVEQPTWQEGKTGWAQPVEGDWSARGANRLLAYVAPGAEPSVVYQNMFDKKNNSQFLDRETSDIFLKNGIRRVCVGHCPHGYAPSVMRGDVEIIAADTSYSDMKAPDNRGKAWSEVVICAEGTIVHGVLPDENPIYYELLKEEGKNNCMVGLPLRYPSDRVEGWWVKAQLKRVNPHIPPMYVLSKVEGFRVSYATLCQVDVVKLAVKPEETKTKKEHIIKKQEIEHEGKVVTVNYPNGSFSLSSKSPDVDVAEVSELPVFKGFLGAVDKNFQVSKMTVRSVDRFGPTIGFVHCHTEVETKRDGRVPGIVFIRGESVAVLPVYVDIDDAGKEYTICLNQPRFATGNSSFIEVPAGMVNLTSETPAHAARRVLEEKAGIEADVCELLNMSELHFGRDVPVFLSPGASDEDMKFFLYRIGVTSEKIAQLTKNFQEQNGKTTMIALNELLDKTNDAKTWIAFSMYKQISHQFHS
uniref:Nudix hydrolase domain-containing protein n=1 Tax=Paramoeba aestuarina TaxID=180227 RepID=A0A7S4KMR0_9EUKA|mmetsp:Transcript_21874/g.34011  ORF Transcript_21874/g.34011 Transcript_21874/m.34011 type:complete len:575 (+) Transcript_21874:96-1820(+)